MNHPKRYAQREQRRLQVLNRLTRGAVEGKYRTERDELS